MHVFSILLFAISSNLDNFVLGISYGIQNKLITCVPNLIVALTTFTGTVISILLGATLLNVIPVHAASILGSVILMCIGFRWLLAYYQKRRSRSCRIQWPEDYHRTLFRNHTASMKKLNSHEAFSLGIALTFNNIGLGIGAGISGLPMTMTSISSFLFSLLFLYLGNQIGKSWLSKLIGDASELIAGTLIIALACYELLI